MTTPFWATETDEFITCGVCDKKLYGHKRKYDYNDDTGFFCCEDEDCLTAFWKPSLCECGKNFCVDYGDRLCHKCYHFSEPAGECWCGKEKFNEYDTPDSVCADNHREMTARSEFRSSLNLKQQELFKTMTPEQEELFWFAFWYR
tara:strand:+ start:591 stop:1025 length:435 start_codon:yes stop_codon:yes gene_type:complete